MSSDGDDDEEQSSPHADSRSVIRLRPPLSLLCGALQTAGLNELLSQQGALTLFAPTSEAFTALAPAELQALLSQ